MAQKVYIDAEKLKRQLQKRDVTEKEASLSAGYNPWYLARSYRTGVMSLSMALSLKKDYNIDQETYELVGENNTEEVENSSGCQHVTINYAALEKVLESVIYNAGNRALNE